LLETIAGLCAQALERAALYEREHATAQTLTRSLLPVHLPEIPGVELGYRYAPTPLQHSEVGGDFYDVVPLGDAKWLLIVGDVAGKGPEAAALTGLVRYTLRAEARHNSEPDHLLAVLNDAILAQRSDGRFCTIACARLDLADPGGPVLELSSAGHPPPLLLDVDGGVDVLTLPGRLLGIFPETVYESRRLTFAPGSTLVLYTDGLLDASAPKRELTADDLAEHLAGAPTADLQTVVDRLYERALGARQRAPRDDIAILAARLQGPAERASSRRAPSPTNRRATRRTTGRRLAGFWLVFHTVSGTGSLSAQFFAYVALVAPLAAYLATAIVRGQTGIVQQHDRHRLGPGIPCGVAS
jgi:serine phosphatase RsbU (regulator of sigma subunit)